MTIKKSRSGIWLLLYLLLSAVFSGCAGMSYEELEAEAEITGDTSKLDKRDAQVERATAYYQRRANCKADNLVWMCGSGKPSDSTPPPGESIDGLLRRYRKDGFAGCGCATPADVREQMRSLGY